MPVALPHVLHRFSTGARHIQNRSLAITIQTFTGRPGGLTSATPVLPGDRDNGGGSSPEERIAYVQDHSWNVITGPELHCA